MFIILYYITFTPKERKLIYGNWDLGIKISMLFLKAYVNCCSFDGCFLPTSSPARLKLQIWIYLKPYMCQTAICV